MRSARSRSEGSSICIGLSYWPERSGMVWDTEVLYHTMVRYGIRSLGPISLWDSVGFYWYDPMVWYQRGISHVGQNLKKRSNLDIR